MNLTESKYKKYDLTREMMETSDIIRHFDQSQTHKYASIISGTESLFIAGEGSSRIFPAKRMIFDLLKRGLNIRVHTDGSTQAMEYDLDDFVVFGASNSGQTKELIRLFEKLKIDGNNYRYGITSNINTRLEQVADGTHILKCGKEKAVAATKSVFEQALFYDALLHNIAGDRMENLDELADMVNTSLTMKVDEEITNIIARAGTIYFAGRNNGVAEELTLKTNEITRLKSQFLEGTYSLHGIEEVMNSDEVIIWINPFPEEIDKFEERLVKGVGLKIIAISPYKTKFPTLLIPDGGKYAEYVELAAGWNILVEAGIMLGIDLDKPVRARKVGNEHMA